MVDNRQKTIAQECKKQSVVYMSNLLDQRFQGAARIQRTWRVFNWIATTSYVTKNATLLHHWSEMRVFFPTLLLPQYSEMKKNTRFLISKKTSRDETSPNALHTVLLAMGLDWHVLSISFFWCFQKCEPTLTLCQETAKKQNIHLTPRLCTTLASADALERRLWCH